MTKSRRIRRILWLSFAGLAVLVLALLPKIWADLVYPLKYEQYILQSAAEFNLEPTLLAGLIFTESRFNPNATSRVGARGLTQVMPATGSGIAQRLGDSSYTPDKLYDPPTSIRYGAYYVRNLLDRYDNNLDAALAGYNGGPGAANRFLLTGNSDIPVETQGFIVKVKRNRDTYIELYGKDLGTRVGDRLVTEEESATPLWQKIFGWISNN